MPEGDTIYRAARALHKALAGRTVTAFETALAPLARVNDDTPITGRTVDRVESRGKWCLIHFSPNPYPAQGREDQPLILATHMLMSGSWHIYRTGEKWQQPRSRMRVAITCGDFQAVAFSVPIAEFHTPRSLARHPQIPQLGPDILAPTYTTSTGIAALQRRAQTHPDDEVGIVLLNQRVLAGLGNVYKSEVAFAAGVHPFRAIGTLTSREIETMAATAARYMRANVHEGSGEAIVTYTGHRRTTHSMHTGDRLWVYGRHNQPCRRCGTPIEMRKQGTQARVTFWCPECQKQ